MTHPTSRLAEGPSDLAKLSHESWRIFQIMAEFVDGFERLSNILPAVTVFGSARIPEGHRYYQLAEDIGRELSEAGFSVISGGGPGIMEAANKGAFAGPSPSIGLNIQLAKEQANDYQDITLKFKHFFARKVMLVKNASAYVVLPGGFGTLDELAEIITLIQTGKSRKIPIILVGTDYWTGLLDWFKGTLQEEFKTIEEEDLALMNLVDDAKSVVELIFAHYECRSFQPSAQEKDLLLHL